MPKNDAQVRVAITAFDEASAIARNIGNSFVEMGQTVSGVGSLLGAFAGGLSIAGLVEITKQAAEFGEQIERAAMKTGMAAEQISALKFAAEMSGVGFEQLQKAIGIFDKNLVDLSGKAKGFSAALAAIGVSAKDANGQILPAHDILLKVADAFSKMPDGAQKSAIAMALFGRSGAELIPLLDEGASAIAALEARAKKLGVTLSDEDAKAAKQAHDEFVSLSTAAEGLKFSLGKGLFPVLVSISEAFLGNKYAIRSVVDELELFAIGYASIMGKLVDPIGFYDSMVKGNSKSGMGIQDRLAEEATRIRTDQYQQSELLKKDMESLGRAIPPVEAPDLVIPHEGKLKAVKDKPDRGALEDAKNEQKEFNDAIRESEQLMKSMAPPLNDLDKAWQDYADRLEEINKLSAKMDVGPLIVANQEKFAADLDKALEPAMDRLGTLRNAQLARSVGGPQFATKELKKDLFDLDALGVKFGDDLGTAFNRLAWHGDSLCKVFAGLVEKLMEAVVQVEIFKPLADSLGGKSGGFLGSMLTTLAGGRASGGGVNYGQSYMVGENGPEIFTPSVSGNITPNNKIGGGDVHQHFNIDARGADAGVEYRIKRAMASAMKQATVNGYLMTQEMAKRGG